VDKKFLEEAKPIKIDFTGMGFKVDSAMDLGGGGGCGGSCSTGSCG